MLRVCDEHQRLQVPPHEGGFGAGAARRRGAARAQPRSSSSIVRGFSLIGGGATLPPRRRPGRMSSCQAASRDDGYLRVGAAIGVLTGEDRIRNAGNLLCFAPPGSQQPQFTGQGIPL